MPLLLRLNKGHFLKEVTHENLLAAILIGNKQYECAYPLLDKLIKSGRSDEKTRNKVKGIPARFIIDKEGNVRYAFSGFSGSFDASLMEIDLFMESLL